MCKDTGVFALALSQQDRVVLIRNSICRCVTDDKKLTEGILMKVKHIGFLALLFTLVISAVTLAHAGYDQSAGGSGAISISSLILVGVAFIVGGIFLYKTFARSQSFQAP